MASRKTSTSTPTPSASCDDSDLEKGAVLTSAELEKDGGVTYLVDYELA